MSKELGGFFGWLIVISYGLTLLNYGVKFINRKYGKALGKYPWFKKYFPGLMKFIIQNHRYFGMATVVGIVGHFLIQYSRWGFVISGAVPAGLMLLQGFLGAYGTYVKKKKRGPWLVVHRTLAAVLFVAVVFHLLYVKINY
ncbi:hypothetical protein KCG48_06905 [Proteiniclasticum sp. BAD-10]|uniref:Uncharacterized protein n=1 Tax=Proteiniclasticum sediminis TaxID=2804028 RepID=A0A941CQ73_9CLOT|nr:hypothetical protein [Proteiniclasticum sediminis]MBR0576069.1 hypothetical protein [Proteiniclasticum sediminis]